MRSVHWLLGFAVTLLVSGCASTCVDVCCAPGCEKKGAKTLFEWAVCKEPEPKENGKEANGKNGEENGEQPKNGKNGNGQDPANGNGESEEPEQEEPIATDRPDFTEASSTVGRGRVQLEAGYTFFRDSSTLTTQIGEPGAARFTGHSYPEMLWRIGMFADWFELRIGQNFVSEREITPDATTSISGALDLYLGVKLALTEQKKALPEMALVLQTFVPTGTGELSAGEMLPGFNLLYGWDIVEDCLTAGGSSQINRALDGEHYFVLLAQSFTIGYTLTPKLGAYTEWFALFPAGALDSSIGPEQYADGGLTYKVTNNFQLDIRAGIGLNDHAADFFAGSGFAVRY